MLACHLFVALSVTVTGSAETRKKKGAAQPPPQIVVPVAPAPVRPQPQVQVQTVNTDELQQRVNALTASKGPEAPETLVARMKLNYALTRTPPRKPEAEAEMHNVLAIQQRLLPNNNPDVIQSRTYVAGLLYKEGNMAAARQEFIDILASQASGGSAVQRYTLGSWSSAISAVTSNDTYPAVEEELRALIARCVNILGKDAFDTLNAKADLARALVHQEKWDDALAIERQVLADTVRIKGEAG